MALSCGISSCASPTQSCFTHLRITKSSPFPVIPEHSLLNPRWHWNVTGAPWDGTVSLGTSERTVPCFRCPGCERRIARMRHAGGPDVLSRRLCIRGDGRRLSDRTVYRKMDAAVYGRLHGASVLQHRDCVAGAVVDQPDVSAGAGGRANVDGRDRRSLRVAIWGAVWHRGPARRPAGAAAGSRGALRTWD